VDLFDLLLVIVGAVLVAYLLLVVVVRGFHRVWRVGARLGQVLTAPFSTTFGELDRERRMLQLENDIGDALGLDDASDSRARADIVNAAVAAQRITVLNQQLRASVGQCLSVHWSVAQGSGAIDMAEAARHPWCHRLRQRVVDLCDLLSTHLERYPLIMEAPELIRLQLGIRRVAPQCIACPYFTTSVSDAPRICPTAKAFGYGGAPTASANVVDGEVVEAC
jgi:hypothetical protein